ncbi:hypothetical protein [Microbulbifer hydrolyticus]|uniref:LysM domain-containing protein n=1 Tax=Microbulbifer hydrolyticus TaxID=48074 RepID=A0A6P1TG69_9GAMM|nr:hypothetical protein [Microbulbifer hydrolyticus]MBB5212109.1 hypothetical protein [Microbulbifer hydrolyticus]QHQ39782.1 hypothetical protein GTQ55_12840 [Microbulbifer hydrolyticus]
MEKELFPDEALFFVADSHYSVEQVYSAIYGHAEASAKRHFLSVNAHLVGGAVRPGQIVIITPPDSATYEKWEVLMQEAVRIHEAELRALNEREKRALARNYAFLSYVASYMSPMYGWVNGYFSQKTKMVEKLLDQMDRLYQSSYKTHGHLNSHHFFAQRRALFAQLDQAVNGMVRRELFGSSASALGIKRQLGISSKATLHQWKNQVVPSGIPELSGRYAQLRNAAKNFARLGYVAIGLEVLGGYVNIQKVCTQGSNSERCVKTRYSESFKAGGSVVGGVAGGGLAAYGTCNLLFGLETAGTSLLWCGLVVGAAGSYVGSKSLGKGGEVLGEFAY